MYIFIHSTKSGGTAVADLFKEHYNKHIWTINHNFKCSKDYL